MSRLILSRHAESYANKESWISSWTDVELTPEGRKQALKLAHRIQELDIKIDTGVYCSDLRRARETAGIIAEVLDLPILEDAGLRERNFGQWTRLSFAEVSRISPGGWENIFRADDVAPPGGETLTELHNRVEKAINRGIDIWPDGFIVIAHYCSLGAILGKVTGQVYNSSDIPKAPPLYKIVDW